jgi:hypothetical protein
MKMWITVGCLTAALALPTALRADNLVSNGDFATGDFSTWVVTDATNSASLLYVTGGPGSYYASFGAYEGVPGDLTTYDGISQVLSTTAGTQYTLSFWLKNEYIPLLLVKGTTAVVTMLRLTSSRSVADLLITTLPSFGTVSIPRSTRLIREMEFLPNTPTPSPERAAIR